jgi:hypothetical protein
MLWNIRNSSGYLFKLIVLLSFAAVVFLLFPFSISYVRQKIPHKPPFMLQTFLLTVNFLLGKYLQICVPLWIIGGSLDLSVETWDNEIFRDK